ncbi:hypothetical protein HQ487_04275, partial [Candidatus Uhrbacteria bacterium]|nr:hypothetical protein [Candidatus Uhrbacteria bacterium]
VNAPGNLGRYVKGGAAGVGAKVFGNSAAGQYFKGKQMDTQQAGRAAKFESVDKEKEVVKGKDAAWKKARIESMLKNPPTSDAGKAQQTALFEDMMGDKRLQASLGSKTVEGMWNANKKDYAEMSKDHPEKKDAFDTFKKSNAHYTGSTNLLHNYDDAKGLSDDALKNEGVQERLKKLRSTVKDKDSEGGYLSAYDAIAQGHEGAKKQSLMTSKPADWYEHMTDSELQNVDANALGKDGSEEVIQRGIQASLGAGDTKRANDIISQMGERYSSEKDPKKQAEILSTMDSTAGMLRDSQLSGSGTALAHLGNTRAAKEREVPPPPARLREKEDGEAFADGMKNASKERKTSTVSQLTNQEVTANQEIEAAKTKRTEVTGGKATQIQTELEALTQALSQARTKIDKELQDKTSSLSQQFATANRELSAVSKNPAAFQSWKDEAQKKVDEVKTQLDNAKKQSSFGEDRAKAVENDERVQKIKIEIESKSKQLPEDMSEVKALNQRISDLTEHIKQLSVARAKLK